VCVPDDALLHRGRVQTQTICMDVCIVNISRGGARLRYDPEVGQAPAVGERLLFNAQLQPFGELSRYRPSTVRWSKDTEFGLAFDHPLSLSVPDIMCIIKH